MKGDASHMLENEEIEDLMKQADKNEDGYVNTIIHSFPWHIIHRSNMRNYYPWLQESQERYPKRKKEIMKKKKKIKKRCELKYIKNVG